MPVFSCYNVLCFDNNCEEFFEVISDKLRSKIKTLLAVSVGILLLSGCGAQGEDDTAQQRESFDEAMALAHFLSADNGKNEQEPSKEITDFTASCRITAGSEAGYLVLGDTDGEYGTLLLIGASSSGEEDQVVIKSYKHGMVDPGFVVKPDAMDITGGTGEFDLQVEVSGGKADITVCGKEITSVDMPFSSLGCVGACKDRGMGDAYMDDLTVLSGGQVVFSDDFDGNFVNELYPYDYLGEREGAFSPAFIKTEGHEGNMALSVPSGMLLSETGKDVAPAFKKDFELKKKDIKSAHLCMTALGSFEAYLNSEKVSDNLFDPGKMIFDQYLNYVTYDVTDMLKDQNELKIYLFHGFYDKGVGFAEVAGIWGDKLAVKGAVVIEYKNGKSEVIPTDETFLACTDTRFRFNDIYQGEIIDDRYTETEWVPPEVDGVIDAFCKLPVFAKENESIAPYKELLPVGVTEPVPGHFVYDFGENVAGTVKIDLGLLGDSYGQEGQVVTFRYGEILNSDKIVNGDGALGTVWTRNLLTARATDYYVFGKRDSYKDVYFSHTYHGFRYLEITGITKPIPEDAITVVAISSDLETTGEFNCSDDIINAFFDNSVRSLRSNLMDSPTDCPQRDERLGWTGDAQAVSGFAMYQFDSKELYRSFLKEIRAMQNTDGAIYDVAPANSCFGGHSCWGDAIITIPWNLYLQYGNKEVLTENVSAGSRWVDYLVEHSEDYIFSSGGYGDHLSMQSVSEKISDTAWCAHSSKLLSKMYKVLGEDELSDKYADISDKFTSRWQQEFIREDYSVEAGILYPDYECETAYCLGLAFELFPEEMRQQAADRLKMLGDYGGELFYPGYSGMAFYLPALCEYGYGDVAARVMTNTAPGGLANLLSMGLTTNGEAVDILRFSDSNGDEYGDGRYYVNGSLNHGAYSSVSEVCYKYILGISPDENAPGYEHFYIRPMMTSAIASASGSFKSVRGDISVSWDSGERTLTCTVPKGSTCTVVLPNGESSEVADGEHSFNW